MGLYLCIFDEDEEIDGVDVGNYSDFEIFRRSVTEFLEQGTPGSKYPVLLNHSDSDGEWSSEECRVLKEELNMISDAFRQLPGRQFHAEWQKEIGNLVGLKPSSLYESFIDVDGEPLLERLIELCKTAIDRQCPILFQ